MSFDISSVSIIGCGNVGSHLAKAFVDAGIRVSHVYSRTEASAQALASETDGELLAKISDVPRQQMVIVAVPDNQIQAVIDQIPADCPIAYTSGSVSLSDLNSTNEIGVFYPLQTFTKGVSVNIFEVPILIESKSEHFTSTLFDLAWKISRKVEFANSETRGKIHLAAVWVNNFVNHCIYQSDQYCNENDINFELLKPLLGETIKKLERQTPYDAQTGPARRGDENVISKQLEMQTGIRKELYKLLSESITKTYHNDQL